MLPFHRLLNYKIPKALKLKMLHLQNENHSVKQHLLRMHFVHVHSLVGCFLQNERCMPLADLCQTKKFRKCNLSACCVKTDPRNPWTPSPADEKGQRILIKSCWTAVDNFYILNIIGGARVPEHMKGFFWLDTTGSRFINIFKSVFWDSSEEFQSKVLSGWHSDHSL